MRRRTHPSTLCLLLLGACEVARAPGAPEPPCVPSGDDRVVCSRIHPPGILDVKSPEHHAPLLRGLAYDFATCATCHGRDFSGGTSRASCLGCHERGPTDCTTCHAQLPDQGAHRAHLGGATVEQPTACAECHVVPARWDAPGHVLAGPDLVDPPPVEVQFRPQAGLDAPPTFDPQTQSCRNLTCHGARIPNVGAAEPVPRWDEPRRDLGCGRCHGNPPTTPYHTDPACEHCHGRVASQAAGILNPALHLDGQIDLGVDGLGRCASCHTSLSREPMHSAHLEPTLNLAGALDCGGCHLAPRTATAAGHLDSPPPVEVFPPGHTGVAWTRDATPTWDPATQSCAGSWCHGKATTIAWRRYPSQLYCGSCHGVPPADPNHVAAWDVRECARCHDSVDAYGNPKLVETSTRVASRHLDGKVDVR